MQSMKTVRAVIMSVIFDIFVSVILVHIVLKSCARCFVNSPNVDVWQTLAEMFNKLAAVDLSSVDCHVERPAESRVNVSFTSQLYLRACSRHFTVLNFYWSKLCYFSGSLHIFVSM